MTGNIQPDHVETHLEIYYKFFMLLPILCLNLNWTLTVNEVDSWVNAFPHTEKRRGDTLHGRSLHGASSNVGLALSEPGKGLLG